MDQITCLLPGGYLDEQGTRHQYVELTPLNGRVEALVASSPRGPALVTQLLSHCIQCIGAVAPSTAIIGQLLVADRQYLLLKLRQATLGSQTFMTLSCPQPSCGHKMDVDFMIDDVPVAIPAAIKPCYSMELSLAAAFVDANSETQRTIVFRLPNGTDQEVLAPLLAESRDEEAATLLLQRCIQRLGPQQEPDQEQISRLSALARWEIEQAIEATAPRVELMMEGECPECAYPFAAPFDLETFFFGELGASINLLYREVHYLAYHYHWSEREIMDMPRAKRRRYIEVLADEIERMNHAI